MTLKILAAGAVLAASLSASAAFAETAFLPGLYETKVRMPQYGNDTNTARDCVTPAEAKADTVERKLAEALANRSCKYSSRSVGGGKFALAGTCVDQGVKSTFRQTGTYTPTAMTMTMTATIVMNGKPMNMDMIMSSRRIAPTCPAGSDD